MSEKHELPHVHFGSPESKPVDWRKMPDRTPDDDELRPASHSTKRLLGFDPAEAVDAGAPKQERAADSLWYHGSPVASLKPDFSNFTAPVAFFTKKPSVAESYAVRWPGYVPRQPGPPEPVVYSVRLAPARAFDLRKSACRDLYPAVRAEHNARCDEDDRLPPLGSPGFVSSNTGFPAGRYAKDLLPVLRKHDYEAMLCDEQSDGWSLAVLDPEGKARVVGVEPARGFAGERASLSPTSAEEAAYRRVGPGGNDRARSRPGEMIREGKWSPPKSTRIVTGPLGLRSGIH